jgi:hypothetical protein
MQRSTRAIARLFPVVALLTGHGCYTGSDGSGGLATLTIINASQSAVRIGIDRKQFYIWQPPETQSEPMITDLTPLLLPGESTTVSLPVTSLVEQFDVFVIGLENDSQPLGSFPCQIDRYCLNAGTARIVWTGETVLFTSADQTLIELTNDGTETLYLLVEDEEPVLALLPLNPGESRHLQLPRGPGNFYVRAVRIDPLLGPILVAYTYCSLFDICQPAHVDFDGQTLICGES